MAKRKQGRKPTVGRATTSSKATNSKVARPSAANTSTLQRLSTPILLRLHGMPRWLFPFLTALLLVGGLLIGNTIIATTLLALLTLILLWLVALSWPILATVARIMRLLVLGALLYVTISRARGQL